MPVSVQCSNPACRKGHSVPETLLGRTVRCKHCGEAFLAQSAKETLSPAADSKYTARRPGRPPAGRSRTEAASAGGPGRKREESPGGKGEEGSRIGQRQGPQRQSGTGKRNRPPRSLCRRHELRLRGLAQQRPGCCCPAAMV